MDPAAVEDRLQGLKELLPRLLADQPPRSPVAAVMEVMATALVELEEAIDRTLHDHWLALANGELIADKALEILLRLGAQLEIDETLSAEERRQAVLVWAFQQQKKNGAGALLNALEQALPHLCVATADGERLAALLAELPAAMDSMQMRLQRAWQPPLRAYGAQLCRGDGPLLGASDGLSRLGALLAMPRWSRANGSPDADASQAQDFEAIEAYRRRLPRMVRLLGQGVTSPGAMLRLAITMVGADCCPRLAKWHDTWIAYGLPPEQDLLACPLCSSRAGAALVAEAFRSEPPPRCPLAWFEARLIDSPLREERLRTSLDANNQEIEVSHASLAEALPELRIEAQDQAIGFPVLENRATGQKLLFAGTLHPGEVLLLQPQVEDPGLLLDSNEPIDPYPWKRQFPQGRAQRLRVGASTVEAGGGSAAAAGEADLGAEDVSRLVWLLSGDRFAEDPAADVLARSEGEPAAQLARFDQSRFGESTSVETPSHEHILGSGRLSRMRLGPLSGAVRTLRLVPGLNRWRSGCYGENLVTTAGTTPEKLLGTTPSLLPPCRLSLGWWSRPPASFRLELEPILEQGGGTWRQRAERIGALSALEAMLQRIRPSGVAAAVRFPEPPWRESHSLREQSPRWQVTNALREAQCLEESLPNLQVHAQLTERQPLGDGQLAWGAAMDTGHLDWIYLH